MSEAYLIGASTGPVLPISGLSRSEQARPVIEMLLEKTRIPDRNIEEVHWIGRREFRLNTFERANGQVAFFHWPSSPLLAHFVLQACGRALETGERNLLLLAQETEGQVIVLMLASPTTVGRFNLAPCMRIGLRLSLSSGEEYMASVRAALEKSELDPANVKWLGSALRLDTQSFGAAFPGAQWLPPGAGQPSGDLFLLYALFERLEKQQLALLISHGPHQSGLATLLERI